MEWIELLKHWGPSAIPGVVALLVLRWVGERIDKWTERDIKLSVAIEGLTATINRFFGKP